jgi:hypothetical protein
MTYNFRDDPTPSLPTMIAMTGGVVLQQGSPQGDLITEEFGGDNISVSIVPPRGWSLDAVVWPNGGSGTFSVPDPGVEEVHPFNFTVSQDGQSLSNAGQFKIKKQSDGG